jgi:diguanylate cyclase (GGDEF)-like protein
MRKDGTKVCVSVKRTAVRDERGELLLILESAHELGREEFSVRADQFLHMIVEQAPMLAWSVDRALLVTSYWGSGILFERSCPNQFVGRPICELFQCGESARAPVVHHHKALRGVASRFEYWLENKALDIQLGPLRSGDGDIVGCAGIAVDITARKKAEEEYRFQATHDHLTGLANYGVFVETLEREIVRASRACHTFAVLLLDLDGLKVINDSAGHLSGNRALKRLARVMQEHSRASDLAARYGGDEFGLILIETDPGMAKHIAERIQLRLGQDSGHPALSVSIGVANFPGDGRTIQELLETADRQLYQRKQAGRARGTMAG